MTTDSFTPSTHRLAPKLAHNLETLRSEINTRWPARDHASDGWIGDRAHQARASDHNPDGRGIVHALDIDVDGIDPKLVVRRAIRHGSTHYVIYNRVIWTRERGFRPHRYTGANPHRAHLHVSGRHGAAYENDATGWGIAEPHPAGSRTLRYVPGRPVMVGADVRFVQRFIGRGHSGPADGRFGAHTRDGVRWYQTMRHLPVTGEVDRRTFADMGVTP